jgi:hypothetical protein
MTADNFLKFAKANGGAAVAIVLMYIYIGKLETRLDRVEGQLNDCYQMKEGRNLTHDYATFNPQLAVLTDNKKRYESNKKK